MYYTILSHTLYPNIIFKAARVRRPRRCVALAFVEASSSAAELVSTAASLAGAAAGREVDAAVLVWFGEDQCILLCYCD